MRIEACKTTLSEAYWKRTGSSYSSASMSNSTRRRFSPLDEFEICARYQEGWQPNTIARDFHTTAKKIDEIRARLGVPGHTDRWSFRHSARITRVDIDRHRVFVVQKGAMYAVVAVGDWPANQAHAAPLTRVPADTVLGDGSAVTTFFAQHMTRSVRDEILVLAAWFTLAKKPTFTSVDVVAAAAQVGRKYSKNNARTSIASIVLRGDFARASRGLFALTDSGLVHAKRLFVGPQKHAPTARRESPSKPHGKDAAPRSGGD
jgi:hypothetical protein